jgi:putative ABC transport system permease protein
MFLLKLAFLNAFRHRLRAGLTVLGVCLAVVSFGLLRTVVDAWFSGVDAASATRLVTRNAISLTFPLPLSYKDRIKAVPGVTQVCAGNWFGGQYIDEKNFFPNFAVDPVAFMQLYPEYLLDPAQREVFLRDRKGCVIGAKLATRFGWKIGDPVTLKGTIYPGNFDFTVRAIYTGAKPNVDETQLFFHWDYLNESLKKTAPARANQPGYYVLGIASPDIAAEVSRAVDASFKNSLAETLTETEKAFVLGFISMSEAIIAAIRLVSVLVIVIIMAVAANTMAMTARERLGEYAVLKTLGFGPGFLCALIFLESLTISGLGGILGAALTYPAASAFGRALSDFIPIFHVSPLTIWLQLAAAATVGLTAAAFPAWRATQIRIAAALRRIA